MATLLRTRKVLISVIAIAVLLCAFLETWSLTAHLRGRLAAQLDLRQQHYTFLTYGLEPPERRVIAELLRERYGIELRTVAGDIVSRDMQSYVDGYNGIMIAAANGKFGRNVYKDCADEAYSAGGTKP
jgi:hypothetical protein